MTYSSNKVAFKRLKNYNYMQQSKLNINFDDVQLARELANKIAKSVQSFVDNYTQYPLKERFVV